jgi:DNA-binding transcriptional LysR family regulator
MRYDLTSLEIFVAVADAANLTRAAEQQHLAVSAISKRITELEGLAGSRLLLRHARGVSLTPAGKSLLGHARQMLHLVERMKGDLCEYAGGLKGVVRLHANTSALVQFLPPELQAFLVRYPMIRLQIEERTGAAIVGAVGAGTADIGILGGDTPLGGLQSLRYHSDRLALAIPIGHPLASRSCISYAEALEHDFVAPHADSSLWALMTRYSQATGRSLEPSIQVSSFECICQLVECGLGIALLPERLLSSHVAAGRMLALRLEDEWADRQLVVVARDLENAPSPVRALIDHLQESVARPDRAAFSGGERSLGIPSIFHRRPCA